MDVNTLGNIDAFSWMNVVKTKAKLLKGNVKKNSYGIVMIKTALLLLTYAGQILTRKAYISSNIK